MKTTKSLYQIIKEIIKKEKGSFNDESAHERINSLTNIIAKNVETTTEALVNIEQANDDKVIEGLEVEISETNANEIVIKKGRALSQKMTISLDQDTEVSIPEGNLTYDSKEKRYISEKKGLWYVNLKNDNELLVERGKDGFSIASVDIPSNFVSKLVVDTKDLKPEDINPDSVGVVKNLWDTRTTTKVFAEDLQGKINIDGKLTFANESNSLTITENTMIFRQTDGKVLAEYGKDGAKVGNIKVTPDTLEAAGFVAGSQGFQIRANGDAEFNNVTARGTIYANDGYFSGSIFANLSGNIAGWDINPTELTSPNNAIRLQSVNKKILVGGIEIDGINQRIQTTNFQSANKGWRIDNDIAEFNNIVARGELRAAVFTFNEIHATAGTQGVFKSAGKLRNDFTSVDSPSQFSFNLDDPPYGHAQMFVLNDILRIRQVGAGSITDNWMEVDSIVDNSTYYTYTCTKLNGTATTFQSGNAIIDYGQSGDGFLIQTADQSYAPYMDIATHTGSPWSETTSKVRIGNLAGITDNLLNPSGYGIYTSNGYFSGNLVALSGFILGGVTIGGTVASTVVSNAVNGDTANTTVNNNKPTWDLVTEKISSGNGMIVNPSTRQVTFIRPDQGLVIASVGGDSSVILNANGLLFSGNSSNIPKLMLNGVTGDAYYSGTIYASGGWFRDVLTVGNTGMDGQIKTFGYAWGSSSGINLQISSTNPIFEIYKDSNNYLRYNGTTFELSGKLVIKTGSTGVANLSDAGALAQSDSVNLATNEVTNKTGAYITYTTGGGTLDSLKPAQVDADVTSTNTALNTSNVGSITVALAEQGATRANTALDSNSCLITDVMKGASLLIDSDLGIIYSPILAGNSGYFRDKVTVGTNSISGIIASWNKSYDSGVTAGFWLDYYSTTSKTRFELANNQSNYLQFDGTNLTIKGGGISGSFISGGTLESPNFYTAKTGKRIEINSGNLNEIRIYDTGGLSVGSIGYISSGSDDTVIDIGGGASYNTPVLSKTAARFRSSGNILNTTCLIMQYGSGDALYVSAETGHALFVGSHGENGVGLYIASPSQPTAAPLVIEERSYGEGFPLARTGTILVKENSGGSGVYGIYFYNGIVWKKITTEAI